MELMMYNAAASHSSQSAMVTTIGRGGRAPGADGWVGSAYDICPSWVGDRAGPLDLTGRLAARPLARHTLPDHGASAQPHPVVIASSSFDSARSTFTRSPSWTCPESRAIASWAPIADWIRR